jgi:hypothetical protein
MINKDGIIGEFKGISFVEEKDFKQICKDRLDFGFDSIYFRYAEACDELAAYMSRADHIDPVEARRRMSGRKMHFYQALEQLVHAHSKEDENDTHC